MAEPSSPVPQGDPVSSTTAFAALRRAHHRFVFPVTGVFLAVYLVSVWLAAYRPGLMAAPAMGLITVGVLVVLANFVVTLAVTLLYGRYANRTLDRLARVATAAPAAPSQDPREVGAP